jgi:hypothetical protein
MGAFVNIIDDEFNTEKEFGYIDDYCIQLISKQAIDSSCMLTTYVLGYENTIFNSAQIEDFEVEINKLQRAIHDSRAIDALLKIKSAIDYSKKDPPLYILFDAD